MQRQQLNYGFEKVGKWFISALYIPDFEAGLLNASDFQNSHGPNARTLSMAQFM